MHCTGKQAWYESRGLENGDTGCGVNRQGLIGEGTHVGTRDPQVCKQLNSGLLKKCTPGAGQNRFRGNKTTKEGAF